MKQEWLLHGAVVPVDVETTAALVAEIKRLIDVVGGMALAQPAQEPVAWLTREDFYRELDRRVERMREEMEIKTVTMRCKEYDLALNIVDMYGGHIVVGQVSFPPQRPWVDLTEDQIKTIEEMALTKQWAIRMALAAVKERNA